MVLDLRPKGGKCHCCHIWGNIEEFFVVVIFFKMVHLVEERKRHLLRVPSLRDFCETNILIPVLPVKKWRSKGDLLVDCFRRDLS